MSYEVNVFLMFVEYCVSLFIGIYMRILNCDRIDFNF